MKESSVSLSLQDEGKSGKKFNYVLEAVRGLAAILVVLGHALSANSFLEKKYIIKGIWLYPAPAHLSVIIFFVLSGYVIGLTNKKPIHTVGDINLYLKKRISRLYPLYVVALIMGAILVYLNGNNLNLLQITAYLLFAQVMFVTVIWENGPLWSLSFEMVYYLAFIPVSFKKMNPLVVSIVTIVIGLLITIFKILPLVIVAYLYGMAMWMIGLYLARLPTSDQNYRYGKIFAFMVLMLCYERMNIISSVMQALHLDVLDGQVPTFFERAITFSDLSYLIIVIPMIIYSVNARLKFRAYMAVVSFIIPLLYLIAYVYSGKIYGKNLFDTLIIAVFFYFLSLIIFVNSNRFESFSTRFIKKISILGSVSYGIYVIHFPILLLFPKVDIVSGAWYTVLIRLVLYFSIVLALGWYLEKKVQPRAKKYFM